MFVCVLNVLRVCQCMCAWEVSWSSIDLKLVISLDWLVNKSLGSPSLCPQYWGYKLLSCHWLFVWVQGILLGSLWP